MKRGRKPLPDDAKVLRGTFRPDRAIEPAVESLDGDTHKAPTWLKGEALKIWRTKVDVYAKRGQSVTGCEGALAQYCAAEAHLIALWRRKADVPVALISAHRVYANEFYDTPASQQAAGTKRAPENRFTRNGQQPSTAAG